MKTLVALALLLPASLLGQTWNGVLSSGRAVNWANAGVSGGIPSGTWTQCGSTIAAGATAATINAAIAACSSNQYVLLGAGTFNLTTGLVWNNKSNVALRGAGANQTFLIFSGSYNCQGLTATICFESSDTNYAGGPSNIGNWTAGYSAGTTSITLSSNTNLTVGNPITLDQLDGTSVLLSVSGNWSNTSGNVWQVTESTITPVQVQFNGTAGTQVGSIGAITAANDWYYTGTTLYVYSTSNPASAFTNPGVVATTDQGNNIFVCYQPQYVCSYSGNNGGASRTNRSQQQIVTVTSISGSGPYTVGISPGLYMPNWASGNTPQAFWATSPVTTDGVESLSLDGTAAGSGTSNVEIFNCKGCWVKGVRSIDAGRSHVQVQLSNHVTVQDSYFFLNQNDSSGAYGVESYAASDMLVQNNIFQQVTAPFVTTGPCAGCVVSYNFDVDNPFGSSGSNWQQQGEFLHSPGDAFTLFEGNQGAGVYADNSHGTGQFITVFRTAANGFQQNQGTVTSSNTIPMILGAYNRFYNLVGNVLGSVALPSGVYENTTADPNSGNEVYSIGFGDEIPNDAFTTTSVMRWGNYTPVTQSSDTPANSGVRFVNSEVPSGLTNYPNSVPGSTTLPASFYLSAKPSWWPTAKAWPAIGPDVSGGNLYVCTSGTYKGAFVTSSGACTGGSGSNAYAGYANTIPAADCYLTTMGGSPIGTGSVLSFNANTCYPTATTIQVALAGKVILSGKVVVN